MTKGLGFSFVDPRVFDAHVSKHTTTDEYHDFWRVTVGPKEEDGERIVIATFHAGNEEVEVTLTVGAAFFSLNDEGLEGDELSATIGDSMALETLYDVVRFQARTLLGMVDEVLEIPAAAPDPVVKVMSLEDASDDESLVTGVADTPVQELS
ncbi:hypothetical protein [Arthrobacter sp. zg-Y1110]|nr:hypothetical protein [Arthrobacter sp. zg-Y1110]UWX85348.1 hypothetical protein N2K99_01910 [Arthrobacter sp. zg-Y1110]